MVTKEDVDVVDALGGKFADAGAKLCRELDIKGGVQVVGIKADGILARARVKQGFVITTSTTARSIRSATCSG